MDQPLTGVQGITFALYKDQQDGAALWLETQNVTEDEQGRFAALLGATQPEGLPLDLFTSGQAHFLGVQAAGQDEQPRILLASVPYALATANAAGDKRTSTSYSTQAASGNSPPSANAQPINSAERAPAFEATSATGPSFISDATSGPPLLINSNAKVANLNADLLDGLDSAYLLNASNINVGTLAAARGGTGLAACTNDQVLKWSGTSWACAADNNSGGTITAVITRRARAAG